MDNVLFISQQVADNNCGIGIIGNLIGNALSTSKKYNFVFRKCSTKVLAKKIIEQFNPIAVIYNYHDISTPWIAKCNLVNEYPNIKHIMIHHDFYQGRINTFNPNLYHGFKYIICPDPTLVGSDSVFPVNRLIPNCATEPYIEKDFPVIGFQGFGAAYKGIKKIALQVVKEFNEAVINLHIPIAHFGANAAQSNARVIEVQNVVKQSGKNISVKFSHDLLSTEELVKMMSQNTINCYFNDYLDGAGLASSPDYALAANRPIALTKSHQFRNFYNIKPSIFIEDNSLKDIISFGTDHLQEMRRNYSIENVVKDYENVIDKICIKH